MIDGLRARAVDAAYASGWSAVKHLPEPAARALFQQVADQAWLRRGRSVAQLERNLRHVVGADVTPHELRELSRLGMRSYLRYWLEAFRLPTWDRDTVIDRIVMHDVDLLWQALDEGRGVVTAGGHMGNWDHAGAWAVSVGLTFTTVAERLRPESLFDRFVAYREGLGMEVLPLTGGDANVQDTLRQRLGEGGLVCLIADRDLSGSGVPVQFFGATAQMPPGPALLALRTGAALLPISIWYDPERTHVRIHPRLEVPASGRLRDRVQLLTQGFADVLAGAVAEHPQDWHMLQRLWDADR